MVQDLIPGGDDELYTLGAYLSESLEPLGLFCGRKLIQTPPGIGTARLAEAVWVDEVVDAGLHLLRTLGCNGLSQVEFKRDPRDGKFKLMEVNPRLWQWHSLARASGVDLPLIAYRDLTGEPVEAVRMNGGRRKWAILLMPGERPVVPRPPFVEATWSWRDPKPAVVHAVRALRALQVKVLLVTMYWPPAGGAGVQRPLKFATHLPALGIETHVLAPDDPKWIHRDDELVSPTQAWVHRARYVGPKGRRPAEELHGAGALERAAKMALLTYRRVLVPDENVTWNATAIPAAVRVVRAEGIDVVVTTSPPNSVHLIGAAVKRLTGVKWVADVRDSMVRNADRPVERLAARAKERTQETIGRLIARYADESIAVSDFIAEELRSLGARAR